jgi:hypothetical protein
MGTDPPRGSSGLSPQAFQQVHTNSNNAWESALAAAAPTGRIEGIFIAEMTLRTGDECMGVGSPSQVMHIRQSPNRERRSAVACVQFTYARGRVLYPFVYILRESDHLSPPKSATRLCLGREIEASCHQASPLAIWAGLHVVITGKAQLGDENHRYSPLSVAHEMWAYPRRLPSIEHTLPGWSSQEAAERCTESCHFERSEESAFDRRIEMKTKQIPRADQQHRPSE